MSNGRMIKVGVFGGGKFANDEHLPNLKRIEGANVVANCDLNEAVTRQTAAKFGIPQVYTDGHEMIDKENMDAMWSIVPAFTRTDVEATAASKGIHLFSEKPQAIEMDEAVRQAGVFSTVGFRERYRPIFQEAKRLLADKEVVHIRFQNVSSLPPLAGSGADR